MVATPKRPGNRSLGFNMTPMIDVVFLLIIFFLISSHLNRQENQVELDLPIAKASTHPSLHKETRIVVSIDPDGRLHFGQDPITLKDFESRLSSALAKLPAQKKDDLEVRIRTDQKQKYAIVEKLMQSCIKKGVWKLKFAVYAPVGEST